MGDFTGFDISSRWVAVCSWPAHLLQCYMLYLYFRAICCICILELHTVKDNANKSVTEKLVKEVKGNNSSFSEADIRGKGKL